MCISLASSTTGPVPQPFPSFPGWVLGAPWRSSANPGLCRHRRSLPLSSPLFLGGPRLLGPGKFGGVAPCPVPCHPIKPWPVFRLPRSSVCVGLRCLSSCRLCCSSKRSWAKSGCCDGLCTGDCAPLGDGVCDPICIGVSSTASSGGSSSLFPFYPGGSSAPHHAGPGSSPRFLLAAAASIASTNMALS